MNTHNGLEEWRECAGNPGWDVSSLGRCRNSRTGRVLKPVLSPKGYGLVSVRPSGNGTARAKRLHRLVAATFIPNPDGKPQVNHKNGVKLDNAVSNLEWCTPKENMDHAAANGLMPDRAGDNAGRRKLTSIDVVHIRTSSDSAGSLAAKFGVHRRTIHHVRRRGSWRQAEEQAAILSNKPTTL